MFKMLITNIDTRHNMVTALNNKPKMNNINLGFTVPFIYPQMVCFNTTITESNSKTFKTMYSDNATMRLVGCIIDDGQQE